MRLLYTSFDVVPAPKGASVHIEQFVKALSGDNAFAFTELITVASGEKEQEGLLCMPDRLLHQQLPAPGADLIARVINFRRFLAAKLRDRTYDVAHFRSPFEGLPIVRMKGRTCGRVVYEVNGLPSIELKYRYPDTADDEVLLRKLTAQEQECLDSADLIVTTCGVTATYLRERGARPDIIKVIPNGVDLDVFSYCAPHELHENETARLLYFGTLSAWQGIDIAVRAAGQLAQKRPVHLTILGPASDSRKLELRELASKCGTGSFMTIMDPLPQRELVDLMHRSNLILVPLTANDRNLRQGCCPLKLLEGMASGTPIVASDIPVAREVAGDTVVFAKSGSLGGLVEQIEFALGNPAMLSTLSQRARKRIEEGFTWKLSGQKLLDAYHELSLTDSAAAFGPSYGHAKEHLSADK